MRDLAYRYWIDDNIVAVEDLGEIDPVTANLEYVLKELQDQLGSLVGKIVIWRDQEGIWDAVQPGKLDVYPLSCQDYDQAKEKLRHYPNLTFLIFNDRL